MKRELKGCKIKKISDNEVEIECRIEWGADKNLKQRIRADENKIVVETE